MATDDKIDELVEKVIDEALENPDKDEELKKRRPKPFRYLNKEEIQDELSPGEPVSVSVMKEPTAPQIVEDNLAILGLGDVETIENVLKKHKASKKSQNQKQ
jgi:hypothetical protein